LIDPLEIAECIRALSPPDRLRFAADLLEHGQPNLAQAIISRAAKELGLALDMQRGGILRGSEWLS